MTPATRRPLSTLRHRTRFDTRLAESACVAQPTRVAGRDGSTARLRGIERQG